jgi:hypothetical protein
MPPVDLSTPAIVAADSPLRLCSSVWRKRNRFTQVSQRRN